jgi:hypothetical protein
MRSKVIGVALLSGKWRVRRLHLNALARLPIYFSLSLAKSYAFKYKAAPGRRNVSHLTRGAISKITGAPAAIRFFHARDQNARKSARRHSSNGRRICRTDTIGDKPMFHLAKCSSTGGHRTLCGVLKPADPKPGDAI